jgi:hypothetical protein
MAILIIFRGSGNSIKKQIIFASINFILDIYYLILIFMKKGILVILSLIFCLPLLMAQNNLVKNNPVGTWKFAAPYAPEGYNSGTIVVGLAEKNHTATMSFTGNENKLTAEKVRAANDSVLFSVYLEGQDIKVLLKMVSDTNMTGKAVYSEGEVPLTLSKRLPSDAAVKK